MIRYDHTITIETHTPLVFLPSPLHLRSLIFSCVLFSLVPRCVVVWHSLKATRARSFKHLRKRFMHGVGYLHGGELQVKLHDPEDCGEYRVNVPMHDVCRWLSVRDHDEIFPKFLADTDAARARLLRWFMGTNGMLFLYAENVGGKGGTKLSVRCCHYEHVAAQTIIGCWKGMKAKLKMKDMIAGIWRKQLDPATRTFVYYNVNSREFKKEKPLCLGTKDLEASAKWEPRQDDKGRTYYVHLKTGRVSLYSEERARRTFSKHSRTSNARCMSQLRSGYLLSLRVLATFLTGRGRAAAALPQAAGRVLPGAHGRPRQGAQDAGAGRAQLRARPDQPREPHQLRAVPARRVPRP